MSVYTERYGPNRTQIAFCYIDILGATLPIPYFFPFRYHRFVRFLRAVVKTTEPLVQRYRNVSVVDRKILVVEVVKKAAGGDRPFALVR